jgi:hypothetical protein
MTVLLTRKQFKDHWEGIAPGISFPRGGLWAYERTCLKKSRWFICVSPLDIHHNESEKIAYWQWCNRNCAGQILCYSTDYENQEEWWGFSHRADIVLWVLKWAQ